MSRLPLALVSAGLATLSLAACIPLPLPVTVYESDTPGSTPVYAKCTLNTHMPDGVSIQAHGVTAQVQVLPNVRAGDANADRIVLRLDLPPAHRVVLADGLLVLDRHDDTAPQQARFPAVSRVELPRSGEVPPALQPYQLPIDTPLAEPRGRHYWLIAPVDLQSARELSLTLPAFSVDGEAAAWPVLHFRRGMSSPGALFNC